MQSTNSEYGSPYLGKCHVTHSQQTCDELIIRNTWQLSLHSLSRKETAEYIHTCITVQTLWSARGFFYEFGKRMCVYKMRETHTIHTFVQCPNILLILTHSFNSDTAHQMFSSALFHYYIMSFQWVYGTQVVSAKYIIHEDLMYRWSRSPHDPE